ncbi:hypothetical protein Tco_1144098 [Tanacetum coccineum]
MDSPKSYSSLEIVMSSMSFSIVPPNSSLAISDAWFSSINLKYCSKVNPLEYANYDSKVINDVSFDGLSFKGLSDIVKACYENNLKIDLFTEHNGYDIIERIDEELHPKKPIFHVDADSNVETNQPLDDVAHVVEQFKHENEGNVNIPRMTTNDPWLNKLVGNSNFIGQTDNLNPNLHGRFLLEVKDPDDEQVESKFKSKQDVSYPFFNLDTPWNKCKPVLGMRFESPQQLKHMLANYGMSVKGSKKGDGRKAVNETLSKVVKEIWDKKKEYEKKRTLNRVTVPLGSGPHG